MSQVICFENLPEMFTLTTSHTHAGRGRNRWVTKEFKIAGVELVNLLNVLRGNTFDGYLLGCILLALGVLLEVENSLGRFLWHAYWKVVLFHEGIKLRLQILVSQKVVHNLVAVFVIDIIVLRKHVALKLRFENSKITSQPAIEDFRVFAVLSLVSKGGAVVLGDDTFIL